MIKVGQWVNSYKKGIFRVEKIIERYYEEYDSTRPSDKKIGDFYDDRIIISKRIVNSKFKKAIGYCSCSEYFVSPLDKEQSRKLTELLRQNPALLKEMDEYQIPKIKSIHNLRIQLNTEIEKNKVMEIVGMTENGMTLKQIHRELEKKEIKKNFERTSGNYVLQLTNIDHEMENERFIWRIAELIANKKEPVV